MNGYDTASIMSGRKGSVLGGVVLLHLWVGYGMYTGLAQKLVHGGIPPPLDVHMAVAPPETTKIKPTAPEWSKPAIFVPPLPDPVMAREPDADTGIVTAPIDAQPPEGLPAGQARAKVETRVQQDSRHPLKIGSDFYPDGAIRAGEQGKCVVQITVSVAGLVTAASIQSSSGFRRLDDACLNAIRGARLLPATEDGKPVEKTASMPIVWTLKGR